MTKRSEPSAAAIAAAGWWAEAVRAPHYDNGDSSGMAGMLMTLVAARQPDAKPEQRLSFADILAGKLQSNLDRLNKFSDWSDADRSITIGVDYGPDHELAEAAREAGISTSKFPWKTTMWIHASHVTVSAGYGAAQKLVWASDEWQASRPVCGQQKWDESRTDYREYHGEPFLCSEARYHDGQHAYDQPLELCASCGRRDDYYHSADERGHMPDFHEFVAPVSA